MEHAGTNKDYMVHVQSMLNYESKKTDRISKNNNIKSILLRLVINYLTK